MELNITFIPVSILFISYIVDKDYIIISLNLSCNDLSTSGTTL